MVLKKDTHYSLYKSCVDYELGSTLYTVENCNLKYFIYKDNEESTKELNIAPMYDLIERKDMTNKEYHIARTLFVFLWCSENTTNTQIDVDQLTEENIELQEVEDFINKFYFKNCLEGDEKYGYEIYWDFLCHFELNSCDFLGDKMLDKNNWEIEKELNPDIIYDFTIAEDYDGDKVINICWLKLGYMSPCSQCGFFHYSSVYEYKALLSQVKPLKDCSSEEIAIYIVWLSDNECLFDKESKRTHLEQLAKAML